MEREFSLDRLLSFLFSPRLSKLQVDQIIDIERVFDSNFYWHSNSRSFLPKHIERASQSVIIRDKELEWWESSVIQMFPWSKMVIKLYTNWSPFLLPLLKLYHQIHSQLASKWPFIIPVEPFILNWIQVSTLRINVLPLGADLIGIASDRTNGEFLVANNKYVWWEQFGDLIDSENTFKSVSNAVNDYFSSLTWLDFTVTSGEKTQAGMYNLKVEKVDDGVVELIFTDMARWIWFFIFNNLTYRSTQLAQLLEMEERKLLEAVKQSDLGIYEFNNIYESVTDQFFCDIIRKRLFNFSSDLTHWLTQSTTNIPVNIRSALIEAWYIQ